MSTFAAVIVTGTLIVARQFQGQFRTSNGDYSSMWHIDAIDAPEGRPVVIYGGLPGKGATCQIGDRLGPVGASYTVTIVGLGSIVLTDIGSSDGGATYGVQVNGGPIVWKYSGEGHVKIDVAQGGAWALSGGLGPQSGSVIARISPVDVTMKDSNGFVFYMQSDDIGMSYSLSVSNPIDSLQFILPSASVSDLCDCAKLTIKSSTGVVIDENSPVPAGVTVARGPAGLVYVSIDKPANATWTATVSCDAPGMPWYLWVTATPAGVSLVDSIMKVYPQLSAADAETLAVLGIFVPPPGMAQNDVQSAKGGLEGVNWHCVVCQGTYWAMVAFLIPLVGPYLAAWETWTLVAEVVSHVSNAVSAALDVDSATARRVLDAIAVLLDPMSWPLAICQAQGECDGASRQILQIGRSRPVLA